MAKTIFAPGIESVSGALSKINTKSRHQDDQNMLLATHRTAETMSKACQRMYLRKVGSLPWQNAVPDAEALEQRQNFAHAANAINTRRHDLQFITADQQNFAAVNEEFMAKRGYKLSFTQYYWAAAKKYDLMGEGSFPTSGGLNLTYNDVAYVKLKG